MAAGDDGSPKTIRQQTPVVTPKHDRTGGPMTGGMLDHNKWGWDQIKANNAERLADAQRQDRAQPGSEPARPGSQPQTEQKVLRKFEDRHPAAPDRTALKREQAEGGKPQQVQAQAPTQPGPPDGRSGTRPPDHYKELKKFEDRHPSAPGHDRSR